MKTIRRDNLDQKGVPDLLIAEGVNPLYGTVVVEALNRKFSGACALYHFKPVPDDYVLKDGSLT